MMIKAVPGGSEVVHDTVSGHIALELIKGNRPPPLFGHEAFKLCEQGEEIFHEI